MTLFLCLLVNSNAILFDNYQLNTETQELSQAGRLIPLTPKAYAVLAHLIANRDRLVSKEELLDEIWPETYVDDSAVKRNIMAVRRAIGGGSGPKAHIKTQRARGYRFIATVRVLASGMESTSDTITPSPTQPIPAESLPSPEPVALPPLPQPMTAEAAERKLITALECVVSHTAGTDGNPALETLHDRMQTVYSCTYEEAQRYGGTVQYLTGEGSLILFGMPLALEDHARRAVLCAWALQRRLQRHESPLTLQMALHSGLVVVSQRQERQHEIATVVGDVTTLAAAMARQAPPGAILASASTVLYRGCLGNRGHR
jgi:DNA-binding winged helix-turn-helix (wHTH) protein